MRGAFEARTRGMEGGGEKPTFPHPMVAVGFSLSVLLAFDFNENEFLFTFFWVHVEYSQR